ncbi:MAG TPA: hypothetical protein DCG34_08105 [Clostridiales bacterium]|nr:hypothetical protein [Clostridiales bacterium]
MDDKRLAEILAERLGDVLAEMNISNKELCKLAKNRGYLLNESLISDILNPDRFKKPRLPKYDKIVAIADSLKISADFLMGLSKIKSLKLDYRVTGSLTGLSDNSIHILENWTETVQYIDKNGVIFDKVEITKAPEELNQIIESKCLHKLIHQIKALHYLTNDTHQIDYPRIKNPYIGPSKVKTLKQELPSDSVRNYLLFDVQKSFTELIDRENLFIEKDEIRYATQSDIDDF